MQSIQAKKVIGYVTLPGIIPRSRKLFASGFGYLAFLMANIYSIVRLLPPNHPYLNPKNIGDFGIRHVIGEAANNLVISRKNIDQIFIFAALIAGLVILVLQIALLIYGAVIQPALAAGVFQITAGQAEQDIAFIMLDRVFGIPDMFNSCVDQGSPCSNGAAAEPGNLPHPFHSALHNLFRFYSMGLLIVGVLIFLYFVVIIIGETAVSGTPFGQRFQNIWVPIRLVVAIGLLLPLNYGINTGQYITLFAAKIGSSFATNGWTTFNNTLVNGPGVSANNPTGEDNNLVALPGSPDITPTVAFMNMVHSCAYAYWHMAKDTEGLSALKDGIGTGPFHLQPEAFVNAHMVKNVYPWNTNQSPMEFLEPGTDYLTALDFFDNGNITIRFGVSAAMVGDHGQFDKYKGKVEPTCGEIKISISDLTYRGQGDTIGGPDQMQKYYFEMIKDMWFNAYRGNGGANTAANINMVSVAQRFTARALPAYYLPNDGPVIQCTICNDAAYLPSCPAECAGRAGSSGEVPNAAKGVIIEPIQANLNAEINTAWVRYNENADILEIDGEILNRGWGGAGIWYNRINRANGAFVDSVRQIPTPVSFPILMEQTREQRLAHDSNAGSIDQFQPSLSDGTPVTLVDNTYSGETAIAIAKGLNDYFTFWFTDEVDAEDQITGSVFTDAMNAVFGTGGLMAIRGRNADIHPLAQLAAVGKSLVDSAIFNVLGSTAMQTTGIFQKIFGPASQHISGMVTSIAFLGLTAGFVLFYVLPFLPFVYFFFAVGAWIKSIFEAMVGVPLWALAHLRLDGEGLPGDSASNGYFLIFEIFIRPILTVFGLVAAILIFTAQVRVLNFIWPLVVQNLTGFEQSQDTTIFTAYNYTIRRDIVDQFFFTVIYTIIVYMLATASFKLIDSIPDNILRWMGAGVSSFSDMNDDATQGLTRYAAVGGMTFGRQLTTTVQQTGAGVGGIIGKQSGKLEGMIKNMTSGTGKT